MFSLTHVFLSTQPMSHKFRPIKDAGDLVVTKRELDRTLAMFAKQADAAMERKIAGLLHSLRETPYDMDTREGSTGPGQHDPRADQLQAVGTESGVEALIGEAVANRSASGERVEQEDSWPPV